MTDLKKREVQLKARLEELGGRLDRIEHHLQQPPDPDWNDNAIAHEMDEVLEGLGQAGAAETAAIYAALRRIRTGTYGVCVRCKERIADERLDVVPQTPVCGSCARIIAAAG